MKHAIITMSWITAVCAVIAVPMVNMALFTASASILLGMVVGVVASTLLSRFTVFEEYVGWWMGFFASMVCAFYVWNSLPEFIQSL